MKCRGAFERGPPDTCVVVVVVVVVAVVVMERIMCLIPSGIKAFLMITRRMHALCSTVDRGSWDTPSPPKKSGSVGGQA